MILRENIGTINSEGRQDVVQHSHPNSIGVHFHTNITAPTTQDFIIVDISDESNYKHSGTSYIHIERMSIQVDAATNADYTIEIGYLKNVDATNGDFVGVFNLSGTKATGNTQHVTFDGYPNAPRCTDEYFISSDPDLNDTAFQTDVNLASTLDPSIADTPSGNGDLVMRVVLTGADINLAVNWSYHAH